MLKQLNAGILSFGLMSTMTAPLMAQSISGTSTETNSISTHKSTHNLSVEEYSNLYSSVPSVKEGSNTLAVKNTLSFSDIQVEKKVADSGSIAQRRTSSRSKYKYTAGFDTMNFGWVTDNNGSISSIIGFNLAAGVAYRKYFKPTEDGQFNFSWDVGTILLILPFGGVGADYQWDSGWYVGARALVFPAIFFIDDFFFPVFPSLSVGYRWE